jgi:ABC-type glycerol-3-phosphate transport system substrate-binding protein
VIFGYDISVSSLEDIKSPLPARKVLFSDTEENTEDSGSALTRPQLEINNQPVTPVELVKEDVSSKSKKSWILVILAVVILVLGIAGFLIYKNSRPIKVVTLDYWGLWEDENAINPIIADFEAKNPNIKINYKRKQKEGYRGLLAGRLAKSGSVEDVPDIFRIHNTWIPMFRNYLAPVPTETANRIGLDTDFFGVYETDLKESNQWLTIPLMYDGLVMFYNPDLLKKAGADVPKDWWSLKKTAAKITEKDENGKIKVAGAALGLTDNVDHWSDIVGLMMKQNGVNVKNIGTTENQTKLKDVLSFYTLFKTSDKVWDETLPNSTQFFATGNLGFYFGPSWRVFDIKKLNPNFTFGVAAMPQLPTTASVSTEEVGANPQLTDIYWATYWTEGVNAKSENKEEAWKFLEYLSSTEVLEKMYQTNSQTRAFGEIYPRRSLSEKVSSNPIVKPFVETANKATSWYLASNTGDDGVNTQMQKYFSDAIGAILANSNEASDAVGTLANGIKQLQQKYDLIK